MKRFIFIFDYYYPFVQWVFSGPGALGGIEPNWTATSHRGIPWFTLFFIKLQHTCKYNDTCLVIIWSFNYTTFIRHFTFILLGSLSLLLLLLLLLCVCVSVMLWGLFNSSPTWKWLRSVRTHRTTHSKFVFLFISFFEQLVGWSSG